MWHKKDVDVDLLNAEAESLLGRHDFLSFCKPRERATTIRTLTEFTFERDESGIIVAHLKADAFCHNMVRAMIGACLMVGDGREEAGMGCAAALEAAVRDSKNMLADPRALVLEEVAYPDDVEEIADARGTDPDPAQAARNHHRSARTAGTARVNAVR